MNIPQLPNIIADKNNINDTDNSFIKTIELDGVTKHIVVIKQIDESNIHYVDLSSLKKIDRARIQQAIESATKKKHTELWEVLLEIRLTDPPSYRGRTSLEYFFEKYIRHLTLT